VDSVAASSSQALATLFHDAVADGNVGALLYCVAMGFPIEDVQFEGGGGGGGVLFLLRSFHHTYLPFQIRSGFFFPTKLHRCLSLSLSLSSIHVSLAHTHVRAFNATIKLPFSFSFSGRTKSIRKGGGNGLCSLCRTVATERGASPREKERGSSHAFLSLSLSLCRTRTKTGTTGDVFVSCF
jgi:hypothetical protein